MICSLNEHRECVFLRLHKLLSFGFGLSEPHFGPELKKKMALVNPPRKIYGRACTHPAIRNTRAQKRSQLIVCSGFLPSSKEALRKSTRVHSPANNQTEKLHESQQRAKYGALIHTLDSPVHLQRVCHTARTLHAILHRAGSGSVLQVSHA